MKCQIKHIICKLNAFKCINLIISKLLERIESLNRYEKNIIFLKISNKIGSYGGIRLSPNLVSIRYMFS